MDTNGFHRRAWSTILILSATFFAVSPALATEPAGRVLATTGVVTANEGNRFERPLSRNDVVYPGETLHTGPEGRVQIRFRDDALVDLKPSTEFRIESYRERTADEGGSAVLELLRGALRTVTGAIGHGPGDEYAMDTPVATIGIRGTDYSLEFCDSACAGESHAAGLYGRVDDGSIVAETGAGSDSFATGHYFFIPQGGAPQRIIAPPEGILVDGSKNEEAREDVDDQEVENMLTEGEDLTITDDQQLNDGETFEATFESGEDSISGTLTGVAAAFVGSSGQQTDLFRSDGEDFQLELSDSGALVSVSDSTHSYQVSDTGFSFTGGTVAGDGFAVDWGKWGTGGGGEFDIDGETRTGGLMYAYTDDFTAPEHLSELSGAHTFSYAGGPSAIDDSGNSWAIDTFELAANFSDLQIKVSNLILWTDAYDQKYGTTAEFTSNYTGIDESEFGGELLYTTGGVGGSFKGFLVGDSAKGAVVAFDADDNGTLISGVGVVER